MRELQRKVKDFVLSVERTKAIHGEKRQQLDSKVLRRQTLVADMDELKDVGLLLEKCNITARQTIKNEVESLVTGALQSVFEDPTITFNIEFTSRRNQVEADFFLSFVDRGKKIEGDITETYGGGVVDVIALSLRLILMELLKVDGPILLDEPGRFVSVEYVENFGKFLHSICKKFDRQIILITHNSKLAEFADKKIKVGIRGGKSWVN